MVAVCRITAAGAGTGACFRHADRLTVCQTVPRASNSQGSVHCRLCGYIPCVNERTFPHSTCWRPWEEHSTAHATEPDGQKPSFLRRASTVSHLALRIKKERHGATRHSAVPPAALHAGAPLSSCDHETSALPLTCRSASTRKSTAPQCCATCQAPCTRAPCSRPFAALITPGVSYTATWKQTTGCVLEYDVEYTSLLLFQMTALG